jgi:hypothetical protein
MESKKLTITEIKNSNKKYSEKDRMFFSNGKYLDYYPFFDNSKVAKMFQAAQGDLEHAKEYGLDLEGLELFDWLMFYTIMEFTDITKPKELKNRVQLFVELVKGDYYQEILDNFDSDEVNKILKRFDNILGTLLQQENVMEVFRRELQNLPLENRDILFPQQEVENKNVQ